MCHTVLSRHSEHPEWYDLGHERHVDQQEADFPYQGIDGKYFFNFVGQDVILSDILYRYKILYNY